MGILIVILGISSVWWWQNHQLDTLSPSSLSSQQEQSTISGSDELADETSSLDTNETVMESSEQESNDGAVSQPQETEQAATDEQVFPADNTVDSTTETVKPTKTESQEIAQITEVQKNNNVLAMQFKDDC